MVDALQHDIAPALFSFPGQVLGQIPMNIDLPLEDVMKPVWGTCKGFPLHLREINLRTNTGAKDLEHAGATYISLFLRLNHMSIRPVQDKQCSCD